MSIRACSRTPFRPRLSQGVSRIIRKGAFPPLRRSRERNVEAENQINFPFTTRNDGPVVTSDWGVLEPLLRESGCTRRWWLFWNWSLRRSQFP